MPAEHRVTGLRNARRPVAELARGVLEGPDAATALAALRTETPVAWVPDVGGWLVTGYAEAVTVLRDPRTFTVDHPGFSTAQVVGPSMLSTDGAAHTRHRRPFGRSFAPAVVDAQLTALVDRQAAELVTALRPAGRGDLRTGVAGPLSAAVVAAALGLAAADVPTMLRWYGAIVQAVSDITAGRRPDPAAAVAMSDLAEAVNAAEEQTLVGRACSALTADEVVSNAAVLMFGGIETTEGMIANALRAVVSLPGLAADVRTDPALRAGAVEESLRLEPAAAVVDRYAVQDVELAGAAIAAGELVRVSIAAANRDPQIFERPDEFDARRPRLRDQLAFARGPHACLAADLARAETETALQAVLDGLPGVRLVDPPPARGLVFRKPADLLAVWRLTDH